MKIIVAGLKIREIHEEYVINSLQPVITTTQRKEIRYCIFINMFLRTENSKRVNIFQHFLYALSRARFNFPFISYPDLPRLPRPTSYLQNQGKAPWGRGCSTARVGSGHKIKTDPTEFYGVGLD